MCQGTEAFCHNLGNSTAPENRELLAFTYYTLAEKNQENLQGKKKAQTKSSKSRKSRTKSSSTRTPSVYEYEPSSLVGDKVSRCSLQIRQNSTQSADRGRPDSTESSFEVVTSLVLFSLSSSHLTLMFFVLRSSFLFAFAL